MTVSQESSRWSRWVVTPLSILVIYVLSSGPMLGLAFRLREATGRDEFYAVLFVYYPLFALGRDNPIDSYVEWWVVDVFQTVGPG